MANPMKMMKQVRDMKKIQKQLSKKVVEISSPDGLVSVQARADMTVKRIVINSDNIDGVKAEKLGRVITSTVNSALDSCRKAAAEDMQKLTGGMGLGDMLGS